MKMVLKRSVPHLCTINIKKKAPLCESTFKRSHTRVLFCTFPDYHPQRPQFVQWMQSDGWNTACQSAVLIVSAEMMTVLDVYRVETHSFRPGKNSSVSGRISIFSGSMQFWYRDGAKTVSLPFSNNFIWVEAVTIFLGFPYASYCTCGIAAQA